MTLIIATVGQDSIWLCADRRLSCGSRVVSDSAIKMMWLESHGDAALIGYSGLGMTQKGTQPSTWMSNTLRGRNEPIENLLGVLSKAAEAQLPKHLKGIRKDSPAQHVILMPAFVNDQPRLYGVDLYRAPKRKEFQCCYTRIVTGKSGNQLPPRVAIAGSGAIYLFGDKSWARKQISIIKAHEQKRISESIVAQEFAKLNLAVSKKVTDNSVGRRCIVTWKYRKNSKLGGGGGLQCFNGDAREGECGGVPTIVNGMDLQAILRATMPSFKAISDAMMSGQAVPEMNGDEINARLSREKHLPDDMLP